MPAPIPYWRLSSFYFWYYAALGGFTPYFAQWLHDRGQDAMAISLIFGLWYGTRILAPMSWNALAARSPHPMRWLRSGAALTLLCFSAFLFANGFLALAAVMACFSFFCNAILPQFETLTLDTLHGRRENYGRIRLWGSIGFIAATLAFGWLIKRHGSAGLPLWMLPLYALTAIAAFANHAPPEGLHPHEAAPRGWAALKRPDVLLFLAVAMLMQIGFGPYYVFFTLHLGEHGHGADTIGLLWSLGVLAEIGIFLIAPSLLRRHSSLKLWQICLGLTVLRWAATALIPGSLPAMFALQLLHAASFGVFHACAMQLISAYFPGKQMAQGQALLYAASSGIGGVLGALFAGIAWKAGGGMACFGFGALATLAGLLLALRLRLPASHTSQRPA